MDPGYFWGMLLLLGLLVLPTLCQAGEVAELRLSQVYAIDPDLIAYLEVLDAEGNMVRDVQKDQLVAVQRGQQLKIDGLLDFSQTGQGVAYIFLVDISKSLSDKEFSQMRQVLRSWVDDMGPKDRAAVMTFGTEVKRLQDFTADKETLKSVISQLKITDMQTQLHLGLAQAMDLGRRGDPELPSRRAIITLSDGEDDFAGGMTKSEVLEKMKVDPIPIYAIGYYRAPRRPKMEESLKVLGEFARTSGGAYFRAESNTIPQMFSRMRQRLKDVYQVELICQDCKWDGVVRHLQMTYKQGPSMFNAGLDFRLLAKPVTIDLKGQEQQNNIKTQIPASDTETARGSFFQTLPKWVFLGGGIGLLAIIIAIVVLVVSNQKGERLHPQAPLPGSGPDPGEGANPYQTVQMPPTQAGPARAPAAWSPPAPATGGPGKLLRFTVIRGEADRPPYEANLSGRLVIGRAADCEVAITGDKEISRSHCEITLDQGKVKIADLGSKNGTMVNGVPIKGVYQLNNDDIILVGKTELRVAIT